MENLPRAGTPFTCPDCGGTLSLGTDGSLPRFRCHGGHAWTAGSLGTLKEREQLLRRMAAVARRLGDESQAEIGLLQAARVREQAARLAELFARESGGA